MTIKEAQPASRRSIAVIVLLWAILQIGGLFSPGLLDDVDSIYIEIAREMLHRHDFVTPTIDGIRFFDKPPLMYWMAAASMHVLGEKDWAARLPLALAVLALLLAVYALGLRLFRHSSPRDAPDRGAFYSALALATAIGPYLYTRFFIPDILIALWMTLSVHLFLIALDRTSADEGAILSEARTTPPVLPSQSLTTSPVPPSEAPTAQYVVPSQAFTTQPVVLSQGPAAKQVILSDARSAQSKDPDALERSSAAGPSLPRTVPPTLHPLPSSLLPCLAFAATLALNLLTKGLIGLVFPVAFVLLYLALTRQLHLLPKLHLIPSAIVFAAIALPWHILAAIRNPAIPMPPGLGLPARAGWAWFYLYNEHIARFLGQRIPHDYGQTPIWLFWLYAALWIMPWTTFLPAALASIHPHLGPSGDRASSLPDTPRLDSPGDRASSLPDTPRLQPWVSLRAAANRALAPGVCSRLGPTRPYTPEAYRCEVTRRERAAALTLTLWTLIVLLFFTLSSRQEYYSLPALPALALMAGAILARAEWLPPDTAPSHPPPLHPQARAVLAWHRWFLLPLASLVAAVCLFFAPTAPRPAPGADLSSVLASNPALYNVSLGHIFDLTGKAMGFFRLPLAATAVGMLILGPASYLLRSRSRLYAANLTLAAGMTLVLLAAHEGLVRFNPILGSKALAETILAEQQRTPSPDALILIDGELTAGSTLLFYTRQPVHLVDGRINGPWFGSFWPDAPPIFESAQTLHTLWRGPRRLFLLTYNPVARTADLTPFGPVRTLARSGGKTIFTNR